MSDSSTNRPPPHQRGGNPYIELKLVSIAKLHKDIYQLREHEINIDINYSCWARRVF